MSLRQEKLGELLRQCSARFFAIESNRSSLITITRCVVSPDSKQVTVLITVLPESRAHTALDFAKRKRKDLREYIKKHLRLKRLPFLDIEIDGGELNRQKIDELLNKP